MKQKTEKSTIPNTFNKEQMNTLGVINDNHCEKGNKNSLSRELFSVERSIFQN